MKPADKAKRTVIGIEIDRDELALRIAIECTGVHPPPMMTACAALDEMDRMHAASPVMPIAMGSSFRRAATAAVLYFHECVNAGRQPS